MLRPQMPITKFERALDTLMQQAMAAMLKVELGDSHRHAFIKGQYDGYVAAKEAYRLALRLDDDEDQ